MMIQGILTHIKFSSNDDDSKVRFQSPKYVENSVHENSKDNPKMTSKTLKSMVVTALTAKIRQKNISSPLSDSMSKDRSNKKSALMSSKFKSRKIQKKQTLVLDK
jgi:hypothetical protein